MSATIVEPATERLPIEQHTTRGRVRPAGWSPGTGTLLGAWVASVAIARLTGATAIILLLAAALTTLAFEIIAGWWSARSVLVDSVIAPTVVDTGEPCEVWVGLDVPRRSRSFGRRRVTVLLDDGTVAGVEDRSRCRSDDRSAHDDAVIPFCFESAGLVTRLRVCVTVAGPAGLVWWTRTTTVAIDTLHVAPIGAGPLADVETASSTSDGTVTTPHGRHRGDIDGVRPWRQGDSTNSVHWASSLRTDELIVHDRLAAADQRWLVELDTADPARLRWTLDEGLRLGHDVAVRSSDGAVHRVGDDDAAATWSAFAAHAATVGDDRMGTARAGLLHREVRLRPRVIESDTAITGTARWSGAVAAFVSMAMLVGALDGSTTSLALLLIAVGVGAAVSLWVARRGGKRPVLMQALIIGAVLVALAMIVAQAVDVDGLLAALRGPLPNVLMLLVVLHGFETVDRRTLRVHLAITFVLACYAAGLRIDGALGWWLVAWGTPFLVSLTATSWPAHPPDERVAALRRPVASLRTTGRWAASVLVIAASTLAVLSVVPIPDGPARLGLPALSTNAPTVDSPGGLALPDGSTPPTDPGESAPDRGSVGGVVGYPGFTEQLDTSVRGDLGDEIVMRVRAPEPAFWRGQTFTEFDGRTWTVSPDVGVQRIGPVIEVPPTLGDALGSTVPANQLVQTYFVEQDLPNVVFAAPRPVEVIIDGSLWTRPDGALRSDVTLNAGSVYTVISERVQVDADVLRAQGDLGDFFSGFRAMAGGQEIEPFLELPASTTSRTIELATSLRTPGESTYDTIRAYEAWIAANTEYDLDAPIPAAGADAVDDFLFESQLGFCEQIASALTIMVRSQGVPARLATGYVPGERDRVSGVWNVRGSDAHAWVEVWFPQTGWQPFDPTAQVPLAADAGGDTVGGDLIGAAVSSLVSHRFEVGLVLVGGALGLMMIRLVVLARFRRRRGRWGLLQDRFSAIAVDDSADVSAGADADAVHARTGTGSSAVTTNRSIAAAFADTPERESAARCVADELDRAAFDPSWVDDDDRFERTRSALATLERSRR